MPSPNINIRFTDDAVELLPRCRPALRRRSQTGIHFQSGYYWPFQDRWSALHVALQEMAERHVRRFGLSSVADFEEIPQYQVPLNRLFSQAAAEYSNVSVDSEVMGGAPCLSNTRIPVYMILDAIEHYGEVEAVMRSYPSLSLQQIKDAIGFAKLVVECPIDERSTPAS